MRYLARPLVDGLAYEISEDHISIRSTNTCFISVGICAPLEKAALLEQYQRLLHLAKENEVKVSYTTHVRKTVCDTWTEYEAAFEEAKRLFCQMAEQARVLEKRGIHYGWHDDPELDRLIQIHEQFQRYLNRTSVISRMTEIKCHMDAIERYLTAVPVNPCTLSL